MQDMRAHCVRQRERRSGGRARLADVRSINNVGADVPPLAYRATAPACLYKSFFIQELLKEAWGCCIYVVLEVMTLSIITAAYLPGLQLLLASISHPLFKSY